MPVQQIKTTPAPREISTATTDVAVNHQSKPLVENSTPETKTTQQTSEWTSLWNLTRRFSDSSHNTVTDSKLIKYIKGQLDSSQTALLRKQLTSSSFLQQRLKILTDPHPLLYR